MPRVIRFVNCCVRPEHRREYLEIMEEMKERTGAIDPFAGFYLLEDRTNPGRFRECYEYVDEESFYTIERDSSLGASLEPLIERLRQIVPADQVEVETFVHEV